MLALGELTIEVAADHAGVMQILRDEAALGSMRSPISVAST